MKIKRQLAFNDEIDRERLANNLLASCPQRSITQLCAIALVDLAEKYNLADASDNDIRKFMEFYDFIKMNKAEQSIPYPFVMPIPQVVETVNTETTSAKVSGPAETVVLTPVVESKPIVEDVEQPKEDKSSNSLVSDADREKMSAIMTGLFNMSS